MLQGSEVYGVTLRRIPTGIEPSEQCKPESHRMDRDCVPRMRSVPFIIQACNSPVAMFSHSRSPRPSRLTSAIPTGFQLFEQPSAVTIRCRCRKHTKIQRQRCVREETAHVYSRAVHTPHRGAAHTVSRAAIPLEKHAKSTFITFSISGRPKWTPEKDK